ncbi:MAG: bile acid:sodium symporter family protein [Bacteroidota bacterium]
MCPEIDGLRLNFSEDGLFILNISLAIIMFGVALNLKLEDFKRVFQDPKKPLIGLTSQFLILPAFTLLLVYIIDPILCPSMALGMFLVAACPGGNISNFICLLAKGNVALSVSLSAVATILAVFMTPVNFAFWAGFYPPAANLLQEISMDPWKMFEQILLILAVPLALGMWVAHRFPKVTSLINKPLRVLSILIFGGYLIGAISLNWEFIIKYIDRIILIVLVHNALALSLGYIFPTVLRLPQIDRRSISIETGIQNSGIALVLIFNKDIFDGLGGMAIIAALWGIWHIVAGLTMAFIWSRREPKPATMEVASS